MSAISKLTKKNRSKKIKNRMVIETLEPRLLLSGDDLLPNIGGANVCY